MQTIYSGTHSILFDDKDSWTDFGLVPTERPYVVMPPVRENTIEIPGMNGVLDLSDVPLGYPTYGVRTGSWTFYVAHDVTQLSWEQTYAKLAQYFHGRKHQCILTDDRSYYYQGRFSLGNLKADKMCDQITINYTLEPFKWMIWTTTQPWQWDPFDFIYGDIDQSDFVRVVVNEQAIRYTQNHVGCVPITPRFQKITGDDPPVVLAITNSCNGVRKTIEVTASSVGTNSWSSDPTIEFSCPTEDDYVDIEVVSGAFTPIGLKLDFRPGRL